MSIMESNDDKFEGEAPYTNPNNPRPEETPVDPSNTTSHVGQKVEQGVISVREGISEQSSKWEDEQERNIPQGNIISDSAEKYIKDPSPEEVNKEEREQEADNLMGGTQQG